MTTSLDLEWPVHLSIWGPARALAAVMGAKASGAVEIVAIDRLGHRLDLATELGAAHTIDTTVDRRVKNYPFAELNTAIAGSLSGVTSKPALTFRQ